MIRLNLLNVIYRTKTYNSFYFIVNDHKAGIKYYRRLKDMVGNFWIKKSDHNKMFYMNPDNIDHFEKENNSDVDPNSYIIHFKDGQRLRVWRDEFDDGELKKKLPKPLYDQFV